MKLNCYRCKTWPCCCKDGVTLIHGDALDVMPRVEADSIDMGFGSPPYQDARTYGIDAQRDCEEWVRWMLDVSQAASRACFGPVFWVVAGVTRKRNYWPGPEGLSWEWWRRGGDCQLYRPCVYHRIGIPGSGGTDYLRADWEFVLCLKRPGELPFSDNTAMGHPPKWAPGGEMSHRLTDGQRRNQRGHSGARQQDGPRAITRRSRSGKRSEGTYVPPVIANPSNLVQERYTVDEVAALLEQASSASHHKVGSGQMGDPLAHKNEAPFPETLPEFYIRSFCPEGGTVLDAFAGSGTTLAVAREWGRRAIGIEIREEQCEIIVERLRQGVLF